MSNRTCAVVFLAALMACDGTPPPPTAVGTAVGNELPAHLFLARGIALAMADERTQEQVRNDMRGSEFTQHKLSFQTYLASRHQLLRSIASTLNVRTQAVLDSANKLPDMDFFVPSRQHRLTWFPGSSFLVGASRSGSATTVQAFNAFGNEIRVGLEARDDPTALFLIHPAEPKGRRLVLPEDLTGKTVQSRWIEPRFIDVIVKDGRGSIVDRYPVLVDASEDEAKDVRRVRVLGDGDGNSYIHEIYADDGDGFGDCELEYTGIFAVMTVPVNQHISVDYDVSCPDQTTIYSGLGHLLIDAWPDTTTHRLSLKIYELDEFDNDYWGKTWWDWDEFGEQKDSDETGKYSAEVHWVF